MALPWVFANLAAGNQPASKLDDNFNALGAYATVPCTASGTNTITLTPVAGAPTIAAYNQLQAYRFVAANTSSGTVSIQVGALASLPAYRPTSGGPVALDSGFIVAAEAYDAVYDVALNSGGGGFHVYNVIPSSAGGQVYVGRGYGTYTAHTALSTTIPLDDSKPQNTEGTQVIVVNAVTTTATQRVRASFGSLCGTATDSVIAALFQGSAADAINVGSCSFDAAGSQTKMLSIPPTEVVIGSATTTAFSVRVGGGVGNVWLNGTSSARLFGGAAAATLILDIFEP